MVKVILSASYTFGKLYYYTIGKLFKTSYVYYTILLLYRAKQQAKLILKQIPTINIYNIIILYIIYINNIYTYFCGVHGVES